MKDTRNYKMLQIIQEDTDKSIKKYRRPENIGLKKYVHN